MKNKALKIIVKISLTIILLVTLIVRIGETLWAMWSKGIHFNYLKALLFTDIPNVVSLIVLVYVIFVIWKRNIKRDE